MGLVVHCYGVDIDTKKKRKLDVKNFNSLDDTLPHS